MLTPIKIQIRITAKKQQNHGKADRKTVSAVDSDAKADRKTGSAVDSDTAADQGAGTDDASAG